MLKEQELELINQMTSLSEAFHEMMVASRELERGIAEANNSQFGMFSRSQKRSEREKKLEENRAKKYQLQVKMNQISATMDHLYARQQWAEYLPNRDILVKSDNQREVETENKRAKEAKQAFLAQLSDATSKVFAGFIIDKLNEKRMVEIAEEIGNLKKTGAVGQKASLAKQATKTKLTPDQEVAKLTQDKIDFCKTLKNTCKIYLDASNTLSEEKDLLKRIANFIKTNPIIEADANVENSAFTLVHVLTAEACQFLNDAATPVSCKFSAPEESGVYSTLIDLSLRGLELLARARPAVMLGHQFQEVVEALPKVQNNDNNNANINMSNTQPLAFLSSGKSVTGPSNVQLRKAAHQSLPVLPGSNNNNQGLQQEITQVFAKKPTVSSEAETLKAIAPTIKNDYEDLVKVFSQQANPQAKNLINTITLPIYDESQPSQYILAVKHFCEGLLNKINEPSISEKTQKELRNLVIKFQLKWGANFTVAAKLIQEVNQAPSFSQEINTVSNVPRGAPRGRGNLPRVGVERGAPPPVPTTSPLKILQNVPVIPNLPPPLIGGGQQPPALPTMPPPEEVKAPAIPQVPTPFLPKSDGYVPSVKQPTFQEIQQKLNVHGVAPLSQSGPVRSATVSSEQSENNNRGLRLPPVPPAKPDPVLPPKPEITKEVSADEGKTTAAHGTPAPRGGDRGRGAPRGGVQLPGIGDASRGRGRGDAPSGRGLLSGSASVSQGAQPKPPSP